MSSSCVAVSCWAGELSERERRTVNTWVWSSEAGKNHFHLPRQQRREERVVCTHFIHSQTVTGCQTFSFRPWSALLWKKSPLCKESETCAYRENYFTRYTLVSSGSQIELVKRPYKSAGHCDFLLFVSLQLSALVHSGQILNSQCISGGDFWWLFLYFVQTHSFIQELKVRNWLLFSSVPHES